MRLRPASFVVVLALALLALPRAPAAQPAEAAGAASPLPLATPIQDLRSLIGKWEGKYTILATHGYTSSAHAAGPPTPTDPNGGWWDGLIGPRKTIDSDRWFVVASNMLGSSYGSTGPSTVNPAQALPSPPVRGTR